MFFSNETKLKSIKTTFSQCIFSHGRSFYKMILIVSKSKLQSTMLTSTLSVGFASLWECVSYHLTLLHSVDIDFLFVFPDLGCDL